MQKKMCTLAQTSFLSGLKPPLLSHALLLDPLTAAPDPAPRGRPNPALASIPRLPLTSRLQSLSPLG